MNKSISQFNKDCRDFAALLDSCSVLRWRSGSYDCRKGCVKRLPISVQLRIVNDKISRYDNRRSLIECDMYNKHRLYVKRLFFILGSRNYLEFSYTNGFCFRFPCAPSVFYVDTVMFNALKKILL